LFHPSCVISAEAGIDLSSEDSAILAFIQQQARHFALTGLALAEAIEKRSCMTVDGACGQTKAFVGTAEQPGVILKSFLQKAIDVIKGSAQCSPSQNPLDCMRSFLMAKADKCKWTFSNATPSTMMVDFYKNVFEKIMCNASASDRNTFKLSLYHMEACISKNFNRHVMQAGWQKSGLIDLDFHKIMSHWLGYENLTCDAVNGLVGLLPPFLYEMGTKFSLSDKSMQAMQRFFPRDFRAYPTDRSELGFPRQRAALMSWAVEALAARAAQNVEVDARLPDELRPVEPQMDAKGMAICPCARGKFHGRHYDNTDAGWARHITTQSHKNWRADQLGIQGNAADRAVVACAAEMAWFQQDSAASLKELCRHLNLSSIIGKKFVEKKVRDSDLNWLSQYPEDRLLDDFGLAAGQVVLMRQFIAEHVVLQPVALQPVALLARVNPAAAEVYAPPSPFVLAPVLALPASQPPLIEEERPTARHDQRGQAGKFKKKMKL
jgi:hypothetical protein